jgi:hypothetical protein
VAICYTVSYYEFFRLTTLQATSEDFYFPMFLRGVASLLSFIATGIYVANGVPFLEFFSVVFYYLTTRSFLGPVIFSTFFSNFYYHRTIHDLNLLASKVDLANTYQQERFKPLFNSALKSGLSSTDAANASIKGMYGTLQTQASLLALKESFGIIIIIGILLIGGLIISKIYWPPEPKHVTGFVVP